MKDHSSKEGLTAGLEAMEQAGIGGVVRMNAGGHAFRSDVASVSEPWRVNFEHGALECERMRLESTTITGPVSIPIRERGRPGKAAQCDQARPVSPSQREAIRA